MNQPIRNTPRVEYSKEEALEILNYSRAIVVSAISRKNLDHQLPPALASEPAYGAFITLKRGAQLRACTGLWDNPNSNTLSTILLNSGTSASTRDLRFPTLLPSEIPFLSIEINLMYDPQVIQETGKERAKAITLGEHGIVLKHPKGRSVFLPHVATEGGFDAETFFNRLAQKAGLNEKAWRDPEAEVSTFRTKVLGMHPPAPELDITTLPRELMDLVLRLTLLIVQRGIGQAQVPEALTRQNPGLTGIFIQAQGNLSSMSFGNNVRIVDLIKDGAAKLQNSAKQQGQTIQTIVRLCLLGQPILLNPYDFPLRHRGLWRSAFLGRKENGQSLIVPPPGPPAPTPPDDKIEGALKSLNSNPEEWKRNEVSVTAFNVSQIAS